MMDTLVFLGGKMMLSVRYYTLVNLILRIIMTRKVDCIRRSHLKILKQKTIMISIDLFMWLCLSLFLPILFHIFFKNKSSKPRLPRPPGPPGWPVIGNIFDIGLMPHQGFHNLRAKYGSILWLRVGMTNALVVQSAKAAEELFKRHDAAFSDRTVVHSLTSCDYDKGSVAIAHSGEYWRVIRKLCSSELLVPKRISSSAQVRENCVDIMMQWIKDDADVSRHNGGSGEVSLERYITLMTFNLIGNFMLSKDIGGSISEKGNDFCENMDKFMDWNGVPNLSDSFPFLKWIDPQGIKRNTEKYLEKLVHIVSEFVKERIEERKVEKDDGKRDFLDALLEYAGTGGTDILSEKKVAIVILEMFFAGTETTSSTINWGMTELLRNPNSLQKLKDELDKVIGRSRKVKESDLSSLPYLQTVVKETMRLHPSLPLLLPRNAIKDTEFGGYYVPKDTMVLVNAWAIHRDPDAWEDPLSFKPERFSNSDVDHKGHHFELLPFGSGRRSCIGLLLGEKMVSITLAKLVQSFEWKLPGDVSPETMDMRERVGIALRKLVPLKVIPIERKLQS